MRSVFLFLFGICVFAGEANSIDSLKVVLNTSSGRAYASLSKTIAGAYLRKSQYDSAEKYYDLAIEEFIGVQDEEQIGKCLNNKGVSNYMRGRFKESVVLYQEALSHYRTLGNDTLISQSLTNLGLTFKGLSIYDKALEYLYESAKILERLNLKRELAANWDGIGNIHRSLNNSEISLEYLNRALLLRQEIKYSAGIAQSLHNLGIWHLEKKQYPDALTLFEKALIIKREIGNQKRISTTLSKIGELYGSLNNPELSESYFKQALEIRLSINDEIGIVASSNLLAAHYMNSGNFDEVEYYLSLALRLGSETSSLTDIAETYTLSKDYYVQRGNTREALKYANLLIDTREKILDQERAHALMESEIRYEVDRKEQQLLTQELELDFVKKRSQWFVILIVFLLLFVVVFVRLYLVSRKLANERKKGKETVERLLKELSHRTKNHLQAQSSLIKLQSRHLRDQSAKDAMQEVGNRMKAVSLIHQSLLYSETDLKASETIDLPEYVQRLTENLMISFKYNQNKIKIEYKFDAVDVDIYFAVPIGLFVNEAVTNAFKHAFSSQSNPLLIVSVEDSQDSIIVSVQDNGKGVANEAMYESKSFGMTTMKDIATEIRADLFIANENGIKISLKAPKTKSRQL